MRTSNVFQPTDQQIDALVREYPLAQVVSASPGGLLATPLPLLLDRGNGCPYLLGHFARSNPHVDAVRLQPDALVVFMGPESYISPSWFTDRTQAPTWNFATVHFTVCIELQDTIEKASFSVNQLTAALENERPRSWHASELGDRYSKLIPHVVPFRAKVLDVKAKFKLGQNERIDVLREMIRSLSEMGRTNLAAMMQNANAHRL